MREQTARTGGSLERWERWIERWLSPPGLSLLETPGDEAIWSVELSDGSEGQICIKPAALHSDPETFRKITARLGSAHWIDVIRESTAIRIHENAWIEKVQ